MTIQPKRGRFDAAATIRAALSEALPGHGIQLGRDADYMPFSTETMVTVPTVRPVGNIPGNRWVFEVAISLSTVAENIDEAMEECEEVVDALLSITSYQGIRFSNLRVESEPVPVPAHQPSGAAMATAMLSTVMRREAT